MSVTLEPCCLPEDWEFFPWKILGQTKQHQNSPYLQDLAFFSGSACFPSSPAPSSPLLQPREGKDLFALDKSRCSWRRHWGSSSLGLP